MPLPRFLASSYGPARALQLSGDAMTVVTATILTMNHSDLVKHRPDDGHQDYVDWNIQLDFRAKKAAAF